jgi:hypothetical protein
MESDRTVEGEFGVSQIHPELLFKMIGIVLIDHSRQGPGSVAGARQRQTVKKVIEQEDGRIGLDYEGGSSIKLCRRDRYSLFDVLSLLIRRCLMLRYEFLPFQKEYDQTETDSQSEAGQ